MTNKKKMMCSRFPLALIAAAVTIPVLDQPADAQEPKTLETVEVVGTRIKRTDWETATPTQVITAEEIRRSGAVSLGELLGGISPSSGLNVQDLTLGGGFSSGVSTVSLRGLGSHATLVLVNGRRIAASPYADPSFGQSQLFNLNTIPLSAIERIEVLKSGASAIYGSDAIAGVVNIVLRKNYRDVEAGVKYSRNHEGEFDNRYVYGTLVFGTPVQDGRAGYEGFLTFSDSRRKATRLVNSHNVAEDDLRQLFSRNTVEGSSMAYPGNYFIEALPGSGVFPIFLGRDSRCPAALVRTDDRCGYNESEALNLVNEQHGNALSGGFSFVVNRNLSLFTELELSRVRSTYVRPPNGVSETGTVWFAQDGRRNRFQFILPPGHPDNPLDVPVALRYRFHDVGPATTEVTIDTSRLLLGAKGSRAGWDWESAFSHMRIDRATEDKGNLHLPALVNAIETQAYRPSGDNSPQTLASLNPPVRGTGKATHMSWDLKGSRELMNLKGGPLALAAGVETRREELSIDPDIRLVNGEIMDVGSIQASGSRLIGSVFAELSAPFTKRLESQVALRHDHYSDYGNSTTPQLGIKWKPIDSLAIRATYAEGFHAPSLSTIATSNVQQFDRGLRDRVRCGRVEGTLEQVQEACSFTGSSLVRANPDLKPERSDSQTLGLIFAPNARSSLTVDFYRISRTNEITYLNPRFVINNEDRFPQAVIRNPDPATWIPGIPNSGPIQGIILEFINLGRTITRGVDVEATYRHSLGAWGRLVSQLNGSYLIRYKHKVRDNDPYVAYEGGDSFPQFKGNLATTWTYRKYEVTGRINHVSGWRYGNSAAPCFTTDREYLEKYGCRIKSWTTIDLSLRYTGVKNLDMGVGVRNIRNKPAPLDPNHAALGYNPNFHNPYGRHFNIWATYTF